MYLHVRAYYKWTKYFDLIGGLYMHAFMHAEVGVFSLLLLLLSTFVPSHTYYGTVEAVKVLPIVIHLSFIPVFQVYYLK